MSYYLGPIYAIEYGILGIPGHICQGENFQRMHKDWGVIEYGMEAVDAARVECINRKFDDILTFLADGVLPEWQKIGSLETYFAKERQDYLKATETGPKNLRTCRLMWDLDSGGGGSKIPGGRMTICLAYGICWPERKRKDMRVWKNA